MMAPLISSHQLSRSLALRSLMTTDGLSLRLSVSLIATECLPHQAELIEKMEDAQRQLAARGRLDDLAYLRNTLVKYFELGPGAFEEVHGWPLIAS